MGLQEEYDDKKTFLEDDSDKGVEEHEEEGRSLMSHKTEMGPQEAPMSSCDTEYSHKPAPQYSPDDSSVYASLDVRTSEKVMHSIGNLHQRTEAAMDPQGAVDLIAKAGGNDQLALRRHVSAGLPNTSIIPEDWPTPHEPLRWRTSGVVQGTDKQRGKDEGFKDSSEQSEKKRCGLTKVFRRRKGVPRD